MYVLYMKKLVESIDILKVYRTYLERVPRIELGNKPWQGFRLPLHHTRIFLVRETGFEPVRPKTGDFKSPVATITPLSHFGPAYRNRTHIHRVEADCIIHYTNASHLVPQVGLEPTRH